MMFVFVTERRVLDAVEADGANEERAPQQRRPKHAVTTATPLVLLWHPRPAPSLLSDTAAVSSGNVVRIFAQDGDQDVS